MIESSDVLGVLSGDNVSFNVPETWVDEYDHSFRSVTECDREDYVTVMLESRYTRLRVRGEPVVFYRYRYFPDAHESPLDARVDFKDDWGGYIDMDHPAHNMTLRDLYRSMEHGKTIPLPKETNS